MFHLFQATSVLLTVAMLLVQAVCPGLALGCGCQQVNPSSCTASEGSSCCCADETEQGSMGCAHCGPSSDDPSSDESPNDGEPEWHQESVCHCGEQAPTEPPLPQAPDTSEVASLLNWITLGTVGVVTPPVHSIAPVCSQVPSSESSVPNYRQVVYCVWVI